MSCVYIYIYIYIYIMLICCVSKFGCVRDEAIDKMLRGCSQLEMAFAGEFMCCVCCIYVCV